MFNTNRLWNRGCTSFSWFLVLFGLFDPLTVKWLAKETVSEFLSQPNPLLFIADWLLCIPCWLTGVVFVILLPVLYPFFWFYHRNIGTHKLLYGPPVGPPGAGSSGSSGLGPDE